MSHDRLESILNSHFGIQKVNPSLDTESEYLKEIQRVLAERIKYFIRSDVDQLFQILYKIDVNPKLTDQAFDLGEINQIAFKLAESIINRQLQKIDYARKFYGEKKS